MLKIILKNKTGKGTSGIIKCSGTGENITNELLLAITELYKNFAIHDQEAAMAFRLHLLSVLIDPDSPVWKIDDHDEEE